MLVPLSVGLESFRASGDSSISDLGGLGIETGRQRLGTGGLRGLCKECEGCHSKSPRRGSL
jgi:hypothetical protein